MSDTTKTEQKTSNKSNSLFIYFILLILLGATFYIFNLYENSFEKLKKTIGDNFPNLTEEKSDSDLENEQKIEENLISIEAEYLPGPQPFIDVSDDIEDKEIEEIKSEDSKESAEERIILDDKLNYEKLKEKLKTEVAVHVSNEIAKIYMTKLENYRKSFAMSFKLYQKYVNDEDYQRELDQLKSIELFKDFSSLFIKLEEYNENYILQTKVENPNLLEDKLAGKFISIKKQDNSMIERNDIKSKLNDEMAEFLLYLYSDEFLTINFQ